MNIDKLIDKQESERASLLSQFEATEEDMEDVILHDLQVRAKAAQIHRKKITFPKSAVERAKARELHATRMYVYALRLIATLKEFRAEAQDAG